MKFANLTIGYWTGIIGTAALGFASLALVKADRMPDWWNPIFYTLATVLFLTSFGIGLHVLPSIQEKVSSRAIR